MRTRSRSTPQGPLIGTVRYYSGTYQKVPWGYANTEPPVLASEDPQESFTAPPLSEAVIIDSGEPPKRDSINPVSHVKITGPVFNKDVSIINAIGLYTQPYSYGATTWFPSYIEDGYSPSYWAWTDCNSFHRWGSITTDANSFSMFPAPRSRSGELPARVMRKLEDLHLSTTLIEARDFPELYKLFTKRGALQHLLGTLRNIDMGDYSVTLKRLLREYREGHLGLQFGLMPTIQDVLAINREIHGGIRSRRQKFSVAIASPSSDSSIRQVIGSHKAHYNVAELEETIGVVRVDGCRVTDLRPQFNSEAFNQLSNGIDRLIGRNPVGLIWEVLPFSWAIDWLLSVDDVLDNLFLRKSNTLRTEYWTSVKYSYRRKVHYSYRAEVHGPTSQSAQYTWSPASHGPLIQDATSYQRAPVDPPSLIDSLRVRGAKKYNVFLLALIALGFRK